MAKREQAGSTAQAGVRTGTGRSKLRKTGTVASAVAALLLVASCSTSTSNGKANGQPDSSTTAAAGATTTAAATTEAPSTTVATTVTKTDLDRLLPLASDLGTDYKIDDSTDSSDDDSAFDDAVEKACPALSDVLGNADDDDANDAKRDFTTEDGRSISVSLTPDISTGSVKSKSDLEAMVDGVSDCKDISFTSDNIDFTMKLTMRTDDSFGDFGSVMDFQATGKSPQIPGAIEIDGMARMFAVGKIGASIFASSGLDQSTLEKIPLDDDVVASVTKQLESDISKL